MSAAADERCGPTSAAAASLRDVVLARGGSRLLDGVSLHVAGRGTTVIMGPNGAGKSLTLRVLASLVIPDAGQVRWNGQVAPAPRAVAMVFQRPVLLRRSVRANLAHALATLGVPRRDRVARIDALLDAGDIEALAARPARALSGGEQQRVAMVRALCASPSLLLLDEPTASLDPRSTAAIESLARQATAAGCACVLVTHDAGQAQRLADTVCFMHHGRVTETTPADEFFRAPRSAEAHDYLAGQLLLE